jgi:hypothetical protein
MSDSENIQRMPLKKRKRSKFRSSIKVTNMTENISKVTVLSVHLIITIAECRPENYERKGELVQQNDRSIDDDNKHAMPEEQGGMVHEETRIAFHCSWIDKQLKGKWSLGI